MPPFDGNDLPQVRVLRSVPDVDVLQALLAAGAKRAVVIGAGFIGVEVAEALRHRGLDVAIVELASQVLPVLDPEMAHNVETALLGAGVRLHLATSVTAIRQAGGRGVDVELADETVLAADLVLMAIGVRPETKLAVAAGLAVNSRGAVIVDEHLRTSAPDVFAVGDAIELADAVTGSRATVPLAGLANRQGRAVADGLFGHGTALPATFGTAIVRVFGTVAATTGRSEKALRAAGIACYAVHLHPAQHAGYFPGAHPIDLKIVFDVDGRLLGAQATGTDGVDKRIDVLATALRAGMNVNDLADSSWPMPHRSVPRKIRSTWPGSSRRTSSLAPSRCGAPPISTSRRSQPPSFSTSARSRSLRRGTCPAPRTSHIRSCELGWTNFRPASQCGSTVRRDSVPTSRCDFFGNAVGRRRRLAVRWFGDTARGTARARAFTYPGRTARRTITGIVSPSRMIPPGVTYRLSFRPMHGRTIHGNG